MSTLGTQRVLAIDSGEAIDGLSRNQFARYLLSVLLQTDARRGAVVGLDGDWGSGKTWVLNRLAPLADEIETPLRPMFLNFNPWMLSGVDDLVAALLGQLSRQLTERGRALEGRSGKQLVTKAVKAIDKYAGAISSIKHVAPMLNLVMPGAGIVTEGVAAAAQSDSDAARQVIPALPDAAGKKSLPALRPTSRPCWSASAARSSSWLTTSTALLRPKWQPWCRQ